MDKDNSKVVIKPVSNWAYLAACAKRNGCASPSAFIFYCALCGIAVPRSEVWKVRRAWKRNDE